MHRLIKHNIQIRFNLWTDWGSSVFFCINFSNLVIIQLQPETGWQDKTNDLKQVVQRNRDKSSETISWENVKIKKRMHCRILFYQYKICILLFLEITVVRTSTLLRGNLPQTWTSVLSTLRITALAFSLAIPCLLFTFLQRAYDKVMASLHRTPSRQ